MATRYGVDTRMKVGDVLKTTVAYFGPDGLGLHVTQRGLTGVRLEEGTSYVQVHARPGKPTQVDIILHEWEHTAPEFMRKIKK
jgi:hypothetical protein